MDLISFVTKFGSSQNIQELNELLTKSAQSQGQCLDLNWAEARVTNNRIKAPETTAYFPIQLGSAIQAVEKAVGLLPVEMTHIIGRTLTQLEKGEGPLSIDGDKKPVSKLGYSRNIDLLPERIHFWHKSGNFYCNYRPLERQNSSWENVGSTSVVTYSYSSVPQLVYFFASSMFGNAPWVAVFSSMLGEKAGESAGGFHPLSSDKAIEPWMEGDTYFPKGDSIMGGRFNFDMMSMNYMKESIAEWLKNKNINVKIPENGLIDTWPEKVKFFQEVAMEILKQ